LHDVAKIFVAAQFNGHNNAWLAGLIVNGFPLAERRGQVGAGRSRR
jgi:hypothetical protein